MAGAIDPSRLIDRYSALLSLHKTPTKLREYLVGEEFGQYLFDIGFYQGVAVFFDQEVKLKHYEMDDLPSLSRRGPLPLSKVNSDEQNEIKRAFDDHAIDEFDIIPRMMENRSTAERDRSIIFVSSGELSTFAFHSRVLGLPETPQRETIREIASRLGILDDAGAPTGRLIEMTHWLSRCATTDSQVGCSSYLAMCLNQVLATLSRRYKTSSLSAAVKRVEHGGLDGLVALAGAMFDSQCKSVQEYAVFNVKGHAALRQNESQPRALVIYPIQVGPDYTGILYATFENGSKTAEEALSSSFVAGLGPLFLASLFVIQDHIAVGEFVLDFRYSLKKLSRVDQAHLQELVRTVTNSVRNIWAHLVAMESLPAQHWSVLKASIEANRQTLEEALNTLNDAYSVPWSVPRSPLNNESVVRALRNFISGDDRTAMDTASLGLLFTKLDRYLGRAQEELTRSVKREDGQVSVVLLGASQELEIRRPGESNAKLSLNPRQFQVLANVIKLSANRPSDATKRDTFSLEEMFGDEPPDKRELAQFVYYLNKKINSITDGAIERLLVSGGYGSSAYRLTVGSVELV